MKIIDAQNSMKIKLLNLTVKLTPRIQWLYNRSEIHMSWADPVFLDSVIES